MMQLNQSSDKTKRQERPHIILNYWSSSLIKLHTHAHKSYFFNELVK